MSISEPRELTRIDKPAKTEGSIRNLGQQSSAARQPEDSGKQIFALVSQLALTSTREIDRLIVDLKKLREKLKDEGNRIQTDIVEYASLSQSAVQLTKIVLDATRERC
jgi:hypothetical protein